MHFSKGFLNSNFYQAHSDLYVEELICNKEVKFRKRSVSTVKGFQKKEEEKRNDKVNSKKACEKCFLVICVCE